MHLKKHFKYLNFLKKHIFSFLNIYVSVFTFLVSLSVQSETTHRWQQQKIYFYILGFKNIDYLYLLYIYLNNKHYLQNFWIRKCFFVFVFFCWCCIEWFWNIINEQDFQNTNHISKYYIILKTLIIKTFKKRKALKNWIYLKKLKMVKSWGTSN